MLKFYKAFSNSFSGLKYAYRSQWAIRLECFILIFSIPTAFFISPNHIERILMISSVILLPMVELINTAIETTLNRIGLEHHELSGFAKDMASAAMLIAVINVAIVWGMILTARFLT